MKLEVLKNSPFRRLTKLSTVVVLLVVASLATTAHADKTRTRIQGDAAEFFWNSIEAKRKLVKWKSNSTVPFEKFDSATYFKQQENVTCFQRIDLNDENVVSYSCQIEE
ncbi:hypothetical protein [Bdellovibrio sp. HCB2-146]|uniref:hypothetical protein n=1 Tax=Bdellovibrio sp. HCB2-146 TaxID=3394362 RepID=UPI0039BC7289